jgi:hypothetical protein
MRILRLTKTKIAAIVPLVAAMAYPALFALGIIPPYHLNAKTSSGAERTSKA